MSRLLLQATFGPTKASIAEALKVAGMDATATSDDSNIKPAEAWITAQMKVKESLHRAYTRLRSNPRVAGDVYTGDALEPCAVGSRWNKYAFDSFDKYQTVEVAVSGSRYTHTVNGVVRTELETLQFGKYSSDAPKRPPVLVYVGPSDGPTKITVPSLEGLDCTPPDAKDEFWTKDNWPYPESHNDRFKVTASGTTLSVARVNGAGELSQMNWGMRLVLACIPKSIGITKQSYKICSVQEKVGGWISVTTNGKCTFPYDGISFPNPVIQFTTPDAESTQVYEASQISLGAIANAAPGNSFVVDKFSARCKGPMKSGKAFMGIKNSQKGTTGFYQYDRRLRLLENTLGAPANIDPADLGDKACPSVPRTFVNEASCVQRLKGTCVAPSYSAASFNLDTATLQFWYTASNRHVYKVQGLRLAGSSKAQPPCKDGVKSRWIKAACSDVTTDTMGSSSTTVVKAALKKSGGSIRDVFVGDFTASNGGSCSQEQSTIGRHVKMTSTECWQHSHPDEGSVFDFSRWTLTHPGNQVRRDAGHPNPITQFAQTGKTVLAYPMSHSMNRWDKEVFTATGKYNRQVIPVGTFGTTVDFADLDSSLQTKELAKKVGAKSTTTSVGFEACGSRGEVANDPKQGAHFIWGDREVDEAIDYSSERQLHKSAVWASVATRSPDQLRQRVAWALAQILVTSEASFGYEWSVELWANYYDILVHHAFGNYRDILREVSASPLMAQYLTFLNNKAFATSGGKYPGACNPLRPLLMLCNMV